MGILWKSIIRPPCSWNISRRISTGLVTVQECFWSPNGTKKTDFWKPWPLGGGGGCRSILRLIAPIYLRAVENIIDGVYAERYIRESWRSGRGFDTFSRPFSLRSRKVEGREEEEEEEEEVRKHLLMGSGLLKFFGKSKARFLFDVVKFSKRERERVESSQKKSFLALLKTSTHHVEKESSRTPILCSCHKGSIFGFYQLIIWAI